MRRIALRMYVTLDGYAEFPQYPGSSDDDANHGEDFRVMWSNYYDSTDTILFGRRAYDSTAAFWPTSRWKDGPEVQRAHSAWMERTPKVVFSKSMPPPTWENTTVERGDLVEAVAKLRAAPGKNMVLHGGPLISQRFLQLGLIDDLLLMISPVLLGQGKPMFGTRLQQQNLKLIESKTFRDGEVFLRYVTVPSTPPPRASG